jgi:hypothetical protein
MATTDCNPSAFNAQYLGQPIIIAQFGDDPITLYSHDFAPLFLHHPSMDVDIVVNGRADLAATQALLDRMHGGAAAICTTRRMEVQ